MNNPVLKTYNLSKTYKDAIALNKVNINVNAGDIYGFIGKNGSGKTTLMKIIANQSLATSGYFELFGVSSKENLDNCRRKIGCIINNPALNLNLTAKENLLYQNILLGNKNNNRVNDILNIIGLPSVSNKKANNFSLGMKQRLGLGIAILNNPELLILDEPINGLDPEGISDFRDILNGLSENYNTTIFISSHILSELEMIATKYGFINNGNLIEEITLEELENKNNKFLLLDTSDNYKTVQLIKQHYNLEDSQINFHENKIKIKNSDINSDEIISFLMKNQIRVKEFSFIKSSLEDYYKNLTKKII